ncbi:MAG: GH92 family glycosyl hydrolase [Bacteroidota bacterium]
MMTRNLAAAIVFMFFISCSGNEESYLQYVDPFIGTDGTGQTYPGASLPFGMVQLSPDTRNDATQKACGGYHYSDSSILGFSHTHLSGVGQVDYTDILIMPTVGHVNYSPGEANNPDSGYRSRFRHSTEKASPGYYSVLLDDYNIQAELTATLRVGMHRYTFPESKEANIIVDLKHKENDVETVLDAYIKIVDNKTIEGYRRTNGVMSFDHTFYFVAEFSKPFSSFYIALDDKPNPDIKEAYGKNIKSALHFNTVKDEQILVRVGISAIDMNGARKNLEAEIQDWDFDKVVKNAEESWEKELSRIEIESSSEEVKRVFYTSMYHAYLAPQIFQDVDGRFVGAENKVYQSDTFTNYTAFSLWDTFRAWHPLFTIIDQERIPDFIESLLKRYDEKGRLPMWPLTGTTSDGMLGFHATSVITDAWVKGVNGFDIEEAYQAMKNTMMSDEYGLDLYKHYGYIPCEKEGESVSKTLEYSYNDWCVATLAKELGKDEDFEYFNARAHFYENVFDSETKLMRGKYANHSWFKPFNPFINSNYSEGNAYQYTFVPHDTQGLIELTGGAEQFDLWLDDFFTLQTPGRDKHYEHGDVIGQYVHGNEPDHHMAYLYNYVGKPWKTQRIVRKILQDIYNDGANGLAGNEDCGQMSAWYILSSMGFYSFNPGQDIYLIGSPLVDNAVVNLENGAQFKITVQNQSPENIYVQSVKLNGEGYDLSYIKHEDIMNGGEIEFVMGNKPNETWASAEASWPPTVNGNPVVSVPYLKSGDRLFVDNTQITLHCDDDGVKIYYSLDGSIPTQESMLYEDPFTVDKTTQIKFRAYQDGLQPSIVVTENLQKAVFTSVARLKNIKPGIKYNYFEAAYRNTSEIDKFSPMDSGVCSGFTINSRQKEKYFAFTYNGYIKIPEDGIYTFYLESNDGSRLYIDGKEVIDNDDYHGVKEEYGNIAMSTGYHKIELKYFQAGGGNKLGLSWQGPGFEKQEVSENVLFHE